MSDEQLLLITRTQKQQLSLSQKQTTKALYKPVLRFFYWRNKILFKVQYSNVFKYSYVRLNVLEKWIFTVEFLCVW